MGSSPVTTDNTSCFDASRLGINTSATVFPYYTFSKAAIIVYKKATAVVVIVHLAWEPARVGGVYTRIIECSILLARSSGWERTTMYCRGVNTIDHLTLPYLLWYSFYTCSNLRPPGKFSCPKRGYQPAIPII